MPEPDDAIPERLRAHLVRELDGVPLAAPQPVSARYRTAPLPLTSSRVRRLVTAGVVAAVAAGAVGAGAFAAGGPPQVVHWIDRLQFAQPAGTPSAEPSETAEPSPTALPAAEASESPEPGEAQARKSPGPTQSESESGGPTPTRSGGTEPEGDHSSPSSSGHD